MRNTFTIILLTLLITIANNLTAQTTEPIKVTVFENGNPFHTRIPSIVKLANGNLMAFCDNRKNNDADIGTNVSHDIVAKISTDNGKTWGDKQDVLKGISNASDYTFSYGDAATVVDRETGEILLMCTAGRQGMKNPPTTTHVLFAKANGSADGQNWTHSDVSNHIYSLRTDVTQGFITSGHICQSSRIKVGSHYRIYAAVATFAIGSYVIYSDDFGETWHCLGGNNAKPGMNGSTMNSSESKLEELPNGNVLMSCRGMSSETGRYYNIYTYTDQEKAEGSWGELVHYNFGDGLSRSDGEVLLVPAKDSNGNSVDILLQTADIKTRNGIKIFYKVLKNEGDYDSTSDFTNWTTCSFQLSSTTSAYSTMTLDQNNNIAFLYEENSNTGYDIVFQSMSLSYITDGKYTFDSDRGNATDYLAKPLFSANEGEYANDISVEITCATNGATIYYTTDGNEPTTASKKYTGAISISETTTLKAIAMKGELQSEVATATYTIIEKTEEMEENVKPEDGGVYVFYAKLSSGNPLYVYNNNGTLSINSVSNEANVTVSENYLWVCQKASDGSYYFSSLDGTGYLGLNTDERAGFVTDFNNVLKMSIEEKKQQTKTIGYGLKYTPTDGKSRYIEVVPNGTKIFDRTSAQSYANDKTTLFVFNKVPYIKGGTGCGTLSEPMHHGFNVKFARNDDSYNVASTGEGYNCYATLNLPFTVNMPDGVTAYKIKSLSKKENTAVDIEEYSGTVIPRETPVLLQTSGAKGDGMPTRTISFKPTTAKENTEDTGLAGTLGRQVFTSYNENTGDNDGNIYYLLGKKDGHVALYYLAANNSGEMAIANNKAYYKYTGGSSAKPAMLTFNIGSTPTAIKGITDNKNGQSGTWYDLTGRKVEKPSHGIYIRNGKKVVLP